MGDPGPRSHQDAPTRVVRTGTPGTAVVGVSEPLTNTAGTGTNGVPPAAYGGRAPRPVDDKPRCVRCSKVLAWHVGRPWKIKCPRCGIDNGEH